MQANQLPLNRVNCVSNKAQPLTNGDPEAAFPPHSPNTGCVNGATTTTTTPSFWVLPDVDLIFLTDDKPTPACMTSRDYRELCYPLERLDFRLSKFKTRKDFAKYVEQQREEHERFTSTAVPCLEVPHSGFSAPAVRKGQLGKAPCIFDYNILRKHFAENPYPTMQRIEKIADHMQFPVALVKVIFYNKF